MKAVCTRQSLDPPFLRFVSPNLARTRRGVHGHTPAAQSRSRLTPGHGRSERSSTWTALRGKRSRQRRGPLPKGPTKARTHHGAPPGSGTCDDCVSRRRLDGLSSGNGLSENEQPADSPVTVPRTDVLRQGAVWSQMSKNWRWHFTRGWSTSTLTRSPRRGPRTLLRRGFPPFSDRSFARIGAPVEPLPSGRNLE